MIWSSERQQLLLASGRYTVSKIQLEPPDCNYLCDVCCVFEQLQNQKRKTKNRNTEKWRHQGLCLMDNTIGCITIFNVFGIVPWLNIRLAEYHKCQIAHKINAGRNEEDVSPLNGICLIMYHKANQQWGNYRHYVCCSVCKSH